MRWLVYQDRESLQWAVFRTLEWRTERYYPNGIMGRAKKRQVQFNDWYGERPEELSCFIKQSKIIEADNLEEAKLQCQSLR